MSAPSLCASVAPQGPTNPLNRLTPGGSATPTRLMSATAGTFRDGRNHRVADPQHARPPAPILLSRPAAAAVTTRGTWCHHPRRWVPRARRLRPHLSTIRLQPAAATVTTRCICRLAGGHLQVVDYSGACWPPACWRHGHGKSVPSAGAVTSLARNVARAVQEAIFRDWSAGFRYGASECAVRGWRLRRSRSQVTRLRQSLPRALRLVTGRGPVAAPTRSAGAASAAVGALLASAGCDL